MPVSESLLLIVFFRLKLFAFFFLLGEKLLFFLPSLSQGIPFLGDFRLLFHNFRSLSLLPSRILTKITETTKGLRKVFGREDKQQFVLGGVPFVHTAD